MGAASPVLERGLEFATVQTVPTVVTVRTVAETPDALYTGNMPRKRDPDELSSREASALLGISPTRFYELVNEGTIQKHYPPFGKRAYYSKAELQALLEQELKRRESRKSPGTSGD